MSFLFCSLCQILLEWSDWGGWVCWSLWHVLGGGSCICDIFGEKWNERLPERPRVGGETLWHWFLIMVGVCVSSCSQCSETSGSMKCGDSLEWWKSFPRTVLLHGIVDVIKYLLQCQTLFKKGIQLRYVWELVIFQKIKSCKSKWKVKYP
jgi:hypothetical protein